MKKALVYLILCCTALPAGAQTLTLDECRAAAAEHNRTLRDGRFELEAALQTRREALTGYFPQVSATGGVFQAQHGLVQADFGMTIPQLGTMNLPLSMVKRGLVGGITAVQPLFAGLQIVNGNKLARLGEEVGRLQLQKTESEVREQTDAYYWQVVSLRDNLSTIEAVERQLEEIHRQVELSVKAGLVTTNDLLRVELRQQEIASNRLKVENGLKVSKMLLAQHIGVDWRAFDVAAAEFGQPEAPAAFYVPVEEALDNRAEYRLAEKNVEAQKYRKRMERGKRLPTVGVGAGYLYYNVTDKDVDDGLVFAQVSVPISDWWGGAHALKKARIREQQAENDHERNGLEGGRRGGIAVVDKRQQVHEYDRKAGAEKDKRHALANLRVRFVRDRAEQRQQKQRKHVVGRHYRAGIRLVEVECVGQYKWNDAVVHLPERADGQERKARQYGAFVVKLHFLRSPSGLVLPRLYHTPPYFAPVFSVAN